MRFFIEREYAKWIYTDPPHDDAKPILDTGYLKWTIDITSIEQLTALSPYPVKIFEDLIVICDEEGE
jgi:hypothetical protein